MQASVQSDSQGLFHCVILGLVNTIKYKPASVKIHSQRSLLNDPCPGFHSYKTPYLSIEDSEKFKFIRS